MVSTSRTNLMTSIVRISTCEHKHGIDTEPHCATQTYTLIYCSGSLIYELKSVTALTFHIIQCK